MGIFCHQASCRTPPPSCSGTNYQANITLDVGSDLSLSCPVAACPIHSITWLRSDTLQAGRYPLVSSHPMQFGIKSLMPEDSGWYWCVADGYQSGLFVEVIRTNSVTHKTSIASTTAQAPVSTPTIPPEELVIVPLAQGNPDQLSVYQRYDTRWTDQQT